MRVLWISLGCTRLASACTSVAIGKKATADGSVIVGQSEDGDDLTDARIIYVPARDHPEGAMAPSYYTDGPFPRWVSNDLGPGYAPNKFTGPNISVPIGFIPQVAHTYAYWDSNFAIINEHNVAIGETTCSAMLYTCAKGDTRHCEPGRESGEALLDIRMLTMFGLERARSAREAIEVMGTLAYEYGFYGTHDPNGDGESLMVGDADEAWVFHILADPTGTKAIWAAKRVPDDSFTVATNMFTIRELHVSDTENYMASPNVFSVAESRGWWKPGEEFDFTKTYSNGEYNNKYYSGRRMWRALSLAAPSLKLSPDYSDLRYDRAWPWAVKPDKPITLQDVFSLYRDFYVGTEFDMTKGLAAGFGGSPDRFDTPTDKVQGAWERTIALYRTNLVKISQIQAVTPERPRAVAGVAWVAPGPAHYAAFLPLPSGFDVQLQPLCDVTPAISSRRVVSNGNGHIPVRSQVSNSVNWAARKVMMTAQIRFDHMHPLVQVKQQEVEAAGISLLSDVKHDLTKHEAGHTWQNMLVKHVDFTRHVWDQLSQDMLLHFSDNSDIPRISTKTVAVGVDEDIASLGYPAWWLRAVGFDKGPPPPPTEMQCPPACPQALQQLDFSAMRSGFMAWPAIVVATLGTAMVSFGIARRCSSPSSIRESMPYYSKF